MLPSIPELDLHFASNGRAACPIKSATRWSTAGSSCPRASRIATLPALRSTRRTASTLICRGENPVIVYDRQGNFLRTWGKGDFSMRTHGIYVAPNGTIFATDDGNHTVRQFTPEGRLLMTMGTLNVPSDTGYDGKTTGSITHAGPPFNRPTNVAIGPKGDIYISDGYGNARVHMFSPSGQLKRSWGEPGDGPGQFRLPHGIAVAPDGRVFVCDREIDRIQIFSPDGEFLEQWTDTQRPTHLTFDAKGNVYVTELAWHVGDNSYSFGPVTKLRHARFSDLRSERQAARSLGNARLQRRPAALPRRTAWRSTPRTIST